LTTKGIAGPRIILRTLTSKDFHLSKNAVTEIITELTRELGFHRKGSRIVEALSAAIRAATRQAFNGR
jgi:hypothetical protein